MIAVVGPADINLVIAPDGKRIVYHARHASANALDIRSLDTGESVALPQTEEAIHSSFSPDGSNLACFKAGNVSA